MSHGNPRVREALSNYLNADAEFTATFSHHSITTDKIRETILLQNVKDKSGRMVTDHVWVKLPDELKDVPLQRNDTIRLTARSYAYYYDDRNNKVRHKYGLEIHDITILPSICEVNYLQR